MNLITKKELSELAGVDPSTISHALKKKRLETYKGTKEIDLDSPLTKAFLEKIPRQRKNNVPAVNGKKSLITESDDLEKAVTKVQKAQAQKTIEEAGLKKEQRIDRQMKNAVRRSDLFEAEKVNISIMMFLDRILNNNKRYFSAAYDEIVRETLAKGEKVAGLKQKFLNQMEESADTAKLTVCDKLREMEKEQARG